MKKVTLKAREYEVVIEATITIPEPPEEFESPPGYGVEHIAEQVKEVLLDNVLNIKVHRVNVT